MFSRFLSGGDAAAGNAVVCSAPVLLGAAPGDTIAWRPGKGIRGIGQVHNADHCEAAIRAAGKLRVEGKSYVMQDGDVCHFLFNV